MASGLFVCSVVFLVALANVVRSQWYDRPYRPLGIGYPPLLGGGGLWPPYRPGYPGHYPGHHRPHYHHHHGKRSIEHSLLDDVRLEQVLGTLRELQQNGGRCLEKVVCKIGAGYTEHGDFGRDLAAHYRENHGQDNEPSILEETRSVFEEGEKNASPEYCQKYNCNVDKKDIFSLTVGQSRDD